MPQSTARLQAAIAARLEANLPGLVAAADLPAIREFLPYEPGLLQPAKAPQVWVTISRSRAAGPAAFGGANAHHTRTRTLHVGVSVAGQDLAAAEGRLYDYADLIQALLLDDQTAGGEGVGVAWLQTEFSDNASGSETHLFKQALLTFDIARWSALGDD